jgi:hypothetical protein
MGGRLLVAVTELVWLDEFHLGSSAWTLWNDIDHRRGMGATKTSKLLAAKRPHLLPAIDDVVGELCLLDSEG